MFELEQSCREVPGGKSPSSTTHLEDLDPSLKYFLGLTESPELNYFLTQSSQRNEICSAVGHEFKYFDRSIVSRVFAVVCRS